MRWLDGEKRWGKESKRNRSEEREATESPAATSRSVERAEEWLGGSEKARGATGNGSAVCVCVFGESEIFRLLKCAVTYREAKARKS